MDLAAANLYFENTFKKFQSGIRCEPGADFASAAGLSATPGTAPAFAAFGAALRPAFAAGLSDPAQAGLLLAALCSDFSFCLPPKPKGSKKKRGEKLPAAALALGAFPEAADALAQIRPKAAAMAFGLIDSGMHEPADASLLRWACSGIEPYATLAYGKKPYANLAGGFLGGWEDPCAPENFLRLCIARPDLASKALEIIAQDSDYDFFDNSSPSCCGYADVNEACADLFGPFLEACGSDPKVLNWLFDTAWRFPAPEKLRDTPQALLAHLESISPEALAKIRASFCSAKCKSAACGFLSMCSDELFDGGYEDALAVGATIRALFGDNPPLAAKKLLCSFAASCHEFEEDERCAALETCKDIIFASCDNPYELFGLNPLRKGAKKSLQNAMRRRGLPKSFEEACLALAEKLDLRRSLDPAGLELSRFAPAPGAQALRDFSKLAYELGVDPTQKLLEINEQMRKQAEAAKHKKKPSAPISKPAAQRL